jgi:arsenate reductase (thioredoxin)
MDSTRLNVLFLCTGNSARSIIAEAITNKFGSNKFRAFSAGSHPRGEVHPLTLDCLERAKISATGFRSKSWDEFAANDAPHMHFVITVCDQAAGEVCPMWPGQPMTAHWGFEDPVAVEGSDEIQLRAFQKTMYQISNRVSIFLSLPMEKLDRLALQEKVREIGKVEVSAEPPKFLGME